MKLTQYKLNNYFRFLWPEFSVPSIRIGPDEDGGYVVPSAVFASIKQLISFGVNVDWRFEHEVQRKLRIPVQAYDCCSVLRLALRYWLGGLFKLTFNRIDYENFSQRTDRLKDYFIFFYGNAKLFKLRIDKVTALPIFESCNNTLLKCDIEGGEYEILDLIISYQSRFNIIAMEIHNIRKNGEVLKHFFEKLNGQFAVTHLHVNNFVDFDDAGVPDIVEVTFSRRSLLFDLTAPVTSLPIIDLDCPSVPGKPEFQVLTPL
jgi:hypothetical protein